MNEDDKKTQEGTEAPASEHPRAAVPPQAAATPSNPKATLELEKLELETRGLRFKQSLFGRLVEVLQIILPLAALVTLVWTLSTGWRQQQQQSKDAENARLEQAYSKLGSQVSSERMTGVSQIAEFLGRSTAGRTGEVMKALANQLALDEDPAVRSAILNVFSSFAGKTEKDSLDIALDRLVALQRVLVQSSGLTAFELVTAQPDLRGIYFVPNREPGIDPDSLHSLLSRLADLKDALLTFLKAGGHARNMSRIYCPNCDFSALGLDLSGVSFEGAILPHTNWSRLNMKGASFKNASVEGANFTAADLEGADFGTDESNWDLQEYVEANALRNVNPALSPGLYLYEFVSGVPNFTCANLRGASFENYPILARLDDEPPPPPLDPSPGAKLKVVSSTQFDEWPRVFQGANIDGANLTQMREIVLQRVPAVTKSDPYIAQHIVQTPAGVRYRYYSFMEPLQYLQFPGGRDAQRDALRDRDIDSAARSFVDATQTENAKLPPGVSEAIARHRTRRRFRFPGCAPVQNQLDSRGRTQSPTSR